MKTQISPHSHEHSYAACSCCDSGVDVVNLCEFVTVEGMDAASIHLCAKCLRALADAIELDSGAIHAG